MSTTLTTPDEWVRHGRRLFLPSSALSFNGFRQWLHNAERVDHLKIGFIEDHVFVEHLARDAMVDVPTSAATLDGFLAWTEDVDFPPRGHVCYLSDGILIDMSPEEIETHNKVKGTVARCVGGIADRENLGEYYDDRTLLCHRKVRLITEADGTFALWETLRSQRLKAVPRKDHAGEYWRLEGTPDWVMEILSRSSSEKDYELLPALYHKCGIGEFWRIDATGEDIRFEILLRGATEYQRGPVRRSWQYSPLFQRYFRLSRERTCLGMWRYRLLTRKKLGNASVRKHSMGE